MSIEQALHDLAKNASAVAIHSQPPRPARTADWPDAIPEKLRALLAGKGITTLYTHQAEAARLSLSGKNVVVTTPTASGKSLCYILPTLSRIMLDPDARALWLFPTKALAQDQTAAVNDLCADQPKESRVRVYTYDGDTPGSIRPSVRTHGQIVITNPDMLHSGILPNHPKWSKVFQGLAVVVIDEMHNYRGVFGSHLANLLRRLKRIAAFYGAHPVFVLSTATIGNPQELARLLVGDDVTPVSENGAPSAGREFMLWNPPLVDAAQGIRRGVVLESVRLASVLLRRNIQTIVFARSRLNVELISSYLKKRLPHLANRISAYRGGYLPNERRAIEKNLKSGDIRCVVATNALELGIDIGQLEASIMAGYPGSISSLLQQAGRAGRRNSLALSILVASNAPIDQYVVTHADYLFSGTAGEASYINPQNPNILVSHIKCAAFELPFADGERFGGEDIGAVLDYLAEERVVQSQNGRWYWTDRGYPAEEVSLRSTTPGNVVIINTASLDGSPGKAEVIGETDRESAFFLLFEGAIYIHASRHFQVDRLDIDNNKAWVREVRADYYTDAIAKTDIKILSVDSERAGDCPLRFGELLVRTQVPKYKKIRFQTHENIGYGEIHLPEQEMHTQGCWLDLAETIFDGYSLEERQNVLIALSTLLGNLSPVHLLSAPWDTRTASEARSTETGRATVFLFDACPGGIGLAEKAFALLPEILTDARARIAACPCVSGCPSCIGPDPENAMPRYKERALFALERLLVKLTPNPQE